MELFNRTQRGVISLPGAPEQAAPESKPVRRVALMPGDYLGMRPALHVETGASVKRGQILFQDVRSGVKYTAPGAGTVVEIHRDGSGALVSLVIALNAREQAGMPEEIDFHPFQCFPLRDLALCSSQEIKALLLESGVWAALRTRPFGHVADPRIESFAVFINAMDTNPLAPSMDVVAAMRMEDLASGALAVSKLTNGHVFYCRAVGAKIAPPPNIGIMVRDFPAVHPHGAVGVQIHQSEPADRTRPIWHLGLQDVLAIGALIRTGRMDVSRVAALAGPGVKRPRLIHTRLGASLEETTAGELHQGPHRIISGSVLNGRVIATAAQAYLGRYHQQVCVFPETPVPNSMFIRGVLSMLSPFCKGHAWELSAARASDTLSILPLGWYDRISPFDIPVMHLLSALQRHDYAEVEALGGLELDEEDLALCSYVCPEKIDYSRLLREALTALQGSDAP